MNPLGTWGTVCTEITAKRKPDGMGGSDTLYQDGKEFTAAIAQMRNPLQRVGEQEAILGAYKVYLDKDTSLPHWTVFRRNSDGLTLRVISYEGDTQTPRFSPMNCKIVYAEKYELPKGGGQ